MSFLLTCIQLLDKDAPMLVLDWIIRLAPTLPNGCYMVSEWESNKKSEKISRSAYACMPGYALHTL